MSAVAYEVCLAVANANARLQRKLNDELGTFHGLGLADFRLLTALADAPQARMTAAALAIPLGVQPSAAVRQVLALEKCGWIERTKEGAQRWVTLRPPGRRVQFEAAQTAAAVCIDALHGLPAQVLADARAVFNAIQGSAALELRR